MSVLTLLLALAMLGVLAIQVYWIYNSIENKQEQFDLAVAQALTDTSKNLGTAEASRWFRAYASIKNEEGRDGIQLLQDLFVLQGQDLAEQDSVRNLRDIQQAGNRLFQLATSSVYREVSDDLTAMDQDDPISSFDAMERLTDTERRTVIAAIAKHTDLLPIEKRTTVTQINNLLETSLERRNIDSNFEFAVVRDGELTDLRSEDYDLNQVGQISTPLFITAGVAASPYRLTVNMKEARAQILSSVTSLAILSLLLTAFIIGSVVYTIIQERRQREISQIKTDFINNITHEFKTPIATISLALDALRKKQVREDDEKTFKFMGLIRDENKRMHAQVENILQFSQMSKNKLPIEKSRIDMHDVLEIAAAHIEPLVEESGGSLTMDLAAKRTDVLGSDQHLENVFVNLLENAHKYSEGPAKITVHTEEVGNSIVTTVTDEGIGMSKTTQRLAFQQFYREHTGDVHNVKGHGLGLAYSNHIIKNHKGNISCSSTRGAGSTFTIKLPLIH